MSELLNKEIFNENIMRSGSICVLGHVNPDGDCAGSVLGICNYIKNMRKDNLPELKPYLYEISDKFSFLPGFVDIDNRLLDTKYDLVIVCDCADEERLGKFRKYVETAKTVLLIDHHATNQGFGDFCLVSPDASSTSEMVYLLLNQDYFDRSVATCIYTGIVHDTGVFRYSCTHERTMQIAGRCLGMGVDFQSVIEDSFFFMTIKQKKILGNCLMNMQSVFDGKLVYSYVDKTMRDKYGATDPDMDGMIDCIRSTTGASAAFFVYIAEDGKARASLRSNTDHIDVSTIAQKFEGGGHRRAAGCTMFPDIQRDIDDICKLFKEQFLSHGLIMNSKG